MTTARAALPVVHLYLGLVFMAASLILALWAYLLHRRRRPLPGPYWRMQTAALALLGIQVLVGLSMLAIGLRPVPLHYLYAALAIAAGVGQLLLRPGGSLGRMLREEGALSESGAFAILTLLAGLFALRLYMTGVGLP